MFGIIEVDGDEIELYAEIDPDDFEGNEDDRTREYLENEIKSQAAEYGISENELNFE